MMTVSYFLKEICGNFFIFCFNCDVEVVNFKSADFFFEFYAGM